MQHRLATSRIQQEIDEATEREKELREAGTIHTTSEETVDSKVCVYLIHTEWKVYECTYYSSELTKDIIMRFVYKVTATYQEK